MAERPHGIAPSELADDDLRREVLHLHETRTRTLTTGSEAALQAHTERTLALERSDELPRGERRARLPGLRRGGRSRGRPATG